MYSNLWRYAHTKDFLMCYAISTLAGILFLVYCAIFLDILPVIFCICFCMLAQVLLTGSRISYFFFRSVITNRNIDASVKRKDVLIVGAGMAAEIFIQENVNNRNANMNIVCAVDDDLEKKNRKIRNVKVKGTTQDLKYLVNKYNPDSILVAIPSLDSANKIRILKICEECGCEILIMKDLHALMTSKSELSEQVRKIKIEDILGRKLITFDEISKMTYVKNKVVLITGGGGSIGSELCRQIAMLGPKKLVVLDINENNAFEIWQELLRRHGRKFPVAIEICSVRNLSKLDYILETHRPNIIFHAAAHKHVPFMEQNPEEAVHNNIFGTFNLATLAEKYEIERFILVSTDKAVNPTSFMGASKRFCEMIVQYMAKNSSVKFAAVRFGNVLGSNGSVVPLFSKQIEEGGPVTVTHPDIERYFMTIPEAVSLILETADIAKGGEIFVLDMGKPVKIIELAETMIRLAGAKPYVDINIEFTGLRPGEKLYEELLLNDSEFTKTKNNKIFIEKPMDLMLGCVPEMLNELKTVVESNNKMLIIETMQKAVNTYKTSDIGYNKNQIYEIKMCNNLISEEV
ncbi:hypothetical protein SDC9_94385 [bioreactor metagenome]|uniref:Polysaccharide biosynthesis protein CapD-like domain-containing protein n=1 Tax=bioreactor metagenome TaxID=1076179 RepID=A0A645AA16_9ZZZZ